MILQSLVQYYEALEQKGELPGRAGALHGYPLRWSCPRMEI